MPNWCIYFLHTSSSTFSALAAWVSPFLSLQSFLSALDFMIHPTHEMFSFICEKRLTDFLHLTIILLHMTTTMSLAYSLQTINETLSPRESLGARRSLQTLESVGIIWESSMEEEAWGMVGVELLSRERRGRVGWECLWEPWEEKKRCKLVKGTKYHGGPIRMVEEVKCWG